MPAPPGYQSAELSYAERNPQTIMLADGVRVRKTDDGYVVETLDADNETWISQSSSRTIDLGIVDLRQACINGRDVPLMPYVEGRLIKSIKFIPGGSLDLSDLASVSRIYFVTPNVSYANATANTGKNSMAFLTETLAVDTDSLVANSQQTDILGGATKSCMIADVGPLIATPLTSDLPIGTWRANTHHTYFDCIIDPNNHLQQISNVGNGVSGATIPTFDDSGGATSDGTVTWQDLGLMVEGTIHLVAEVYEGISTMPPYPATLEFIDPPTDTAAGEIMAPVTVLVKDQYGNPYTFAALFIKVGILGVGTQTGSNEGQTDKTTGIATFSDLAITEAGTDYILRFWISPTIVADPLFSDPFNIT